MADIINVGIIGAGNIAGVMADTINRMPDVNLYAVASRQEQKAQDFAKRFRVEKAYGSYEDMVKDDNVDLVYIATPHSEHYKNMLLCIEHNKNILCEKAFTVNADMAREVIAKAHEKGLMIAEAMWTRYMPMAERLKALITGGRIGEITMVSANMHFPMQGKERLWEPHLAGGALLDVGIYPLTMASMILGDDINKIAACGKLSDKGMDEYAVATIAYKSGKMAVASWGMSALSDCKATIYGSDGFIVVDGVNRIQNIKVYDRQWNVVEEVTADPSEISGYEYEVEACRQAIQKGKTECSQMPAQKTVFMMELMDEIRRQLGVVYPMEK